MKTKEKTFDTKELFERRMAKARYKVNINNRILLWLDDKRNPFENEEWLRYSPIEKPFKVVWIKTYRQFVKWIQKNGLPDAICFDHDISDFSYDIIGFLFYKRPLCKEKTGYDCAKWLVGYCMDNELALPKWNIQSSNVPGKENINGIFQSYSKYFKNKEA